MEYYVADAFAGGPFTGNPAGVCIMEKPLKPAVMQKIAAENYLPETAFLAKAPQGGYTLRWFTPKSEIDLCGHATLAAAFVVFNYIDAGTHKVAFSTASGMLEASRSGDFYELLLPLKRLKRVALTPRQLKAVGCQPLEACAARDLILVLNSEREVKAYKPDYTLLQSLSGWLGVVVTAKGDEADFVSRYFCPELHLEDPVTGSSHCALVPYWGEKLHKEKMIAAQLSQRGGTLRCERLADKVKIAGKVALYLRGKIADAAIDDLQRAF